MSEASVGTKGTGRAGRAERLVEESGLPLELRGIIGRVVRATRLWKGERAEVARELVAHFRDGLERGESPERLASDFGDEAVAAALVKRSKKRLRPWAWRAWVRAWQGAGVLAGVCVLAYLVMAARYFSIRPNVARNYSREWNEALAKIPAEQRAWPEYRAATLERPRDPELFGWEGWPTGVFDAERWAQTRAYVREIQPLLERVRRAGTRAHFGDGATTREDEELSRAIARQKGRGEDGNRGDLSGDPGRDEENPMMVGVLLPGLAVCRSWARDLVGDARVALEDGEAARALEDYRALLGMSRQLLGHRTLIGQLVGQAIAALACQEAGRALAEHPEAWDEGQLRDLAHEIEAVSACPFPDLRGEREFFDDLVQRIYSDDGRGGGRICPGGIEAMRTMAWNLEPVDFAISQVRKDSALAHAAGPIVSEVTAGRREVVALYNRLMNETQRLGALPAWDRIHDPGVGRLDAEIARLRDRLDTKVVSMVIPAMTSAYWGADRGRMEREGVQVAIALELHRRREGAWPESLGELVPAYLPAVPRDIYDGRALRYVVEGGRARVYSLGRDLDDDGGRGDESGRALGWPRGSEEGPDADAVLWPRERR